MQSTSPSYVAAMAGLAVAGCAARAYDTTGAPSASEAARFLTQATFGVTEAEITAVRTMGYAGWLDRQLALPIARTHQADSEARLRELLAETPLGGLNPNHFYWTFWDHAISGEDQLRERVGFALSEIFVISLTDNNVNAMGAASYYDTLKANAFGNFRTLIEQVALHPMMGAYLTWLGNQKEDPATGRQPDENFAREVMQLMTIGLYQLNLDGTVKVDSGGAPIPTYTADDISGLAKVFTGYSYYSPNPTPDTFSGLSRDPRVAGVRPMIPYPQFHSTSAKAFLGVTIPASSKVDPAGDIKIALDTLFNHPNVGPFISRQLIQRLVTSNPSPAYVGRVAATFNNNGQGVRGDMAATVRAIMLDTEARVPSNGPTYGKVREPVIRLANWARAFGARSQSTHWRILSTSDNILLGQSALTASSVFNFFRPGYSPPNTRVGTAGLVAPEFQLIDEITVAGYINTIQSTIDQGIGTTATGARDVTSTYASEVAIANNAAALVDRVDLLLMSGQMSKGLRAKIVEAVDSVPLPATGDSSARLNRAKLAIFLTMASAEYLVQR